MSEEKYKQDIRVKKFVDAPEVRGVGFEPTNLCRIAASGLRLWPCLATPAYRLCSSFLFCFN